MSLEFSVLLLVGSYCQFICTRGLQNRERNSLFCSEGDFVEKFEILYMSTLVLCVKIFSVLLLVQIALFTGVSLAAILGTSFGYITTLFTKDMEVQAIARSGLLVRISACLSLPISGSIILLVLSISNCIATAVYQPWPTHHFSCLHF